MAIELEEPQIESNAQVLKDLFAGTMGGIAQVLVGQPFDTVKVRLQSAPEGTYTGAIDVIKRLIKNEGFAGFYKGTLTPLVGVGACVSVQFSVNEFMKRYYDRKLQGHSLSLINYFNCGAVAGFANGFLASPIEHIRIRLQTQTGTQKTFNGPLHCAKKIYEIDGIRGIYKGLGPSLVRESVGLGIYFATYEALIAKDLKHHSGLTRSQIKPWKLCLYGGLSGYSLWIAIYPVDVIKSKLQTDALKAAQYKSSLSVIRDVWTKQGIKGFYKGFLPTILRAAPANGATFAVFELTIRLLNK
ncbi:YMC2 [Candida oxycetoniae]|uniref:Mitochondrial thiamine pyrophosphate carrier 1 n=1 Tax=Candida oxycetoniae TaxID=497107 RepID=A0AAI9SZD7_9ASCO|nr:YMC2 [Candida oxycetoniae]KAI3405817.1 YMC2 [Candida oxycetoniae]